MAVDTNIAVAIISASSAAIVAIAALVVNVVWMGRTFEQIVKRLDAIKSRLANVENHIIALAERVARVEERVGIH